MKKAIDLLLAVGKNVDYTHVDAIANEYLEENPQQVTSFCRNAYGNVNAVGMASAEVVVRNHLRDAIISFVNADYHLTDRVQTLRLYLMSALARSSTIASSDGRKKVAICPACKSTDNISYVRTKNGMWNCQRCEVEALKATSPAEETLHKTFSLYSKKGLSCPGCERYVPATGNSFTCPYLDCSYAGSTKDLHTIANPMAKVAHDIPILSGFADGESGKKGFSGQFLMQESVTDSIGLHGIKVDACNRDTGATDLSVRESFNEQHALLLQTIREQKKALDHSSNESTRIHKRLMYEAFESILNDYPQEMVGYLVHETRNGGLQHKIFQDYANRLEKSLPFSFTKNSKPFTITSLLDPNLCIFDGISEFSSVVKNGKIDNKTEELYIGGRKGAYCRSYYIGKLIDVTTEDGQSVMSSVIDHSFYNINVHGLPEDSKVKVKHYRIPPHYQMGGMVYLNRIRRRIVDKIYLQLNGKKRVPKR